MHGETEPSVREPRGGGASQRKEAEQALVGRGSVVMANAQSLSDGRTCKHKHIGANRRLVCSRKHLTK